MELISKIIDDLQIPEEVLQEALYYARRQVKLIKFKKKGGGVRIAYHPARKLKVIQYWLLRNVFKKMPVHENAMAYRENLSIRDNAKKHTKNKYYLKLDLKDFFPSITYGSLKPNVINLSDGFIVQKIFSTRYIMSPRVFTSRSYWFYGFQEYVLQAPNQLNQF